ncbi:MULTISPECIES: histidinol-phosphatase [Methylosinus]|uniref:Histidinol-phosphatase n=1 Tax=Methylosinus sporium TaxID=428 RepID=A0A2U1SLV4_METSR|nr:MULTISPECIES: histidinol-phosphatase [Methylosinus]PWB92597.1 histidinol-phosphatase [Methylosinus sporium]
MTAVDFEKFVERLADASGEAILPFFRTSLAAEDKAPGGAFDPVTEADRAAEIAMRRLIESTFPSHGIIGEEFGDLRADAEYVWVLDPIDGTKSFICGLPLWGTLIGLQHRGRPCYGLMHQPFTRERFSGDGEAAYWRGPARHHHVEPSWKAQPPAPTEERRKLQTRPCATLAEATLMTTSPRLIDERLRDDFFRVEAQTRLSRYGGDCYAYCALAAGHVDLVIETNLNPYDIVALIPIVEGAGGVVTTWDGGPAAQGGAIIAAGDRRVHEAAMRALSAG